MNSMPGWWHQKRQLARRKKDERKARNRVEWTYDPKAQAVEAEPKGPYDPSPNPQSWYQFCTDRKYAYESRGEPIAAMVYWALRAFDFEKDLDPCTEEGYQALCEYWDYKMDGYERRAAER